MTVRDMLSEADAKEKWCPYQDGAEAYRAGNADFGRCIASACMFWRWSHQDHDGTPTGFCGGAGFPKYM